MEQIRQKKGRISACIGCFLAGVALTAACYGPVSRHIELVGKIDCAPAAFVDSGKFKDLDDIALSEGIRQKDETELKRYRMVMKKANDFYVDPTHTAIGENGAVWGEEILGLDVNRDGYIAGQRYYIAGQSTSRKRY